MCLFFCSLFFTFSTVAMSPSFSSMYNLILNHLFSFILFWLNFTANWLNGSKPMGKQQIKVHRHFQQFDDALEKWLRTRDKMYIVKKGACSLEYVVCLHLFSVHSLSLCVCMCALCTKSWPLVKLNEWFELTSCKW